MTTVGYSVTQRHFEGISSSWSSFKIDELCPETSCAYLRQSQVYEIFYVIPFFPIR